VSGLNEINRVAYNLRRLSDSVDFVNVVTWYLDGYWSGFAGFGNSLNGSYEGCYNIVSPLFSPKST
jgi:GH18 family chitinase